MTAATIPRLSEILEQRGDAPPANIPGRWIISGTPVAEPYPCSCWYSPCRYAKCSDRMRTEGDALPEGCCGRNSAPVAASAPEGFVNPPQPASGGSGVPGTRSGAPEGSTDALRAPRGAFSCECETPWDPPPPTLLIADGPKGPLRTSVPLAAKQPDVRALGDAALDTLGRRRARPWKDGRHVLMPPQVGARGKTRPCWHAQLDDGSVAVLDTPDETGSGVHCPDCHRNFHNAGAWQIHRKRDGVRETCKDPATVLAIEGVWVAAAEGDRPSRIEHISHGAPLLRQGMAGVWQTDPLAPWGVKGAPMDRDEASSIWTRAQERLAGSRWRFGRGHNRGARVAG